MLPPHASKTCFENSVERLQIYWRDAFSFNPNAIAIKQTNWMNIIKYQNVPYSCDTSDEI
jgi:hypothetical protein